MLVSSMQQSDSVTYLVIYKYIYSFPYGLLQDIECSFLSYTLSLGSEEAFGSRKVREGRSSQKPNYLTESHIFYVFLNGKNTSE